MLPAWPLVFQWPPELSRQVIPTRLTIMNPKSKKTKPAATSPPASRSRSRTAPVVVPAKEGRPHSGPTPAQRRKASSVPGSPVLGALPPVTPVQGAVRLELTGLNAVGLLAYVHTLIDGLIDNSYYTGMRHYVEALRAKGVRFADVDLEVGAGTFKPVETDDPAEHHMHAERYEVPALTAAAIVEARARGARLWAVGTTVVRTLEASGGMAGRGETQIFITPGFAFRVVDHLITNFHLPRSTLLMLVAAFAGYDETMAAYQHAIAEGYQFYSYGDAMVLI